jgi:Flp pilus assembly protein TadB
MKQTENELARRIASLLDESTSNIAAPAAERLAAARRQALLRHQPRPVSAWGWILTTGGPQSGDGIGRNSLWAVVLAAALVSAIAIALNWHTTGTGSDIAEIDAQLLTDELPINAFLDQGFDSWLKRGSR